MLQAARSGVPHSSLASSEPGSTTTSLMSAEVSK
jgi:hypothetical protein